MRTLLSIPASRICCHRYYKSCSLFFPLFYFLSLSLSLSPFLWLLKMEIFTQIFYRLILWRSGGAITVLIFGWFIHLKVNNENLKGKESRIVTLRTQMRTLIFRSFHMHTHFLALFSVSFYLYIYIFTCFHSNKTHIYTHRTYPLTSTPIP